MTSNAVICPTCGDPVEELDPELGMCKTCLYEPVLGRPEKTSLSNLTQRINPVTDTVALIGHRVPLLDKGFLELVDFMPHPLTGVSGDLAIVNAARVSFLGETKGPEKDKKLLLYLMQHKHSTPFEMCLSGDTLIPTFPTSTAKQKYYSLEELAEAFKVGGRNNAWVKLVKIRTVDPEGVVKPTRIKRVWQTGVRHCWRVTEDSAMKRSLVVTDDHPFLRPDGSYASVSELGIGSEIMMNGTVPSEVSMWHDGYRLQEIARTLRTSKSAVYRSLQKYGVETSKRSGFRRKEDGTLHDPHRLARHLKEAVKCEICGRSAYDIHHIDENPNNNELQNLLSVCRNCHKAFHNPALPKIVYPRKISAIEYVGEMPVYDLETESENHNFVAGKGFVVHNCEFKFRVHAPLIVFWHWARHRAASYNASSGRYVEFNEDEFYVPDVWRLQSSNNKQASEGIIDPESATAIKLTAHLETYYAMGYRLYEQALADGVAREQARLFLPGFSVYYTWIIKVDAHNLMHFLKLRSASDAQYEIRVYAQAIYDHFFKPLLPWTAEAFEKFVLKQEQ